MRALSLSALCALLLAPAGCVPATEIPLPMIPSVTSMEKLMHVLANAADPQFKKLGAGLTDADLVAVQSTGERVAAAGARLKQVAADRPAGFLALVSTLEEQGQRLASAAQAHDVAQSQQLLGELKGTCKSCHKQFR
jgi:hypothetical protein